MDFDRFSKNSQTAIGAFAEDYADKFDQGTITATIMALALLRPIEGLTPNKIETILLVEFNVPRLTFYEGAKGRLSFSEGSDNAHHIASIPLVELPYEVNVINALNAAEKATPEGLEVHRATIFAALLDQGDEELNLVLQDLHLDPDDISVLLRQE